MDTQISRTYVELGKKYSVIFWSANLSTANSCHTSSRCSAVNSYSGSNCSSRSPSKSVSFNGIPNSKRTQFTWSGQLMGHGEILSKITFSRLHSSRNSDRLWAFRQRFVDSTKAFLKVWSQRSVSFRSSFAIVKLFVMVFIRPMYEGTVVDGGVVDEGCSPCDVTSSLKPQFSRADFSPKQRKIKALFVWIILKVKFVCVPVISLPFSFSSSPWPAIIRI